jgi:hypothetical protein
MLKGHSFAIAATGLVALAVVCGGCIDSQQSTEIVEGPVLVPAPPLVILPDGFVPDEHTALAVAEAILLPIYGEAQIASEKPLRGLLDSGIWTVQGTLPEGYVGGTVVRKLSQRDGRVLYLAHEE